MRYGSYWEVEVWVVRSHSTPLEPKALSSVWYDTVYVSVWGVAAGSVLQGLLDTYHSRNSFQAGFNV